MAAYNIMSRFDYLSYKGNLAQTRYGWLRLTPAYSVHLVSALLDATPTSTEVTVLDPFCGTGTTALVCAERGIACDTTDINPFLLWLGQVKTHPYTPEEILSFRTASTTIIDAIRHAAYEPAWIPSLHQIEKWWDASTLHALARIPQKIQALTATLPVGASNLLKIAFCRVMIQQAHVSFSHQSMSFRRGEQTLPRPSLADREETLVQQWGLAVAQIAEASCSSILSTPHFMHCDARSLGTYLEDNHYSCVITSPPYPNRISYIRELRPYMYWLRYLDTGHDAGELDWQAIGGTWGCATSNLHKWKPDQELEIPFAGFDTLLANIAHHSPILSRYVQKYFYDMVLHCHELFRVVRPGGTITYIVGNSKFYDVLLPVEAIFASLFEAAGFADVQIRTIRKRSSKRELFEFAVSAKKL